MKARAKSRTLRIRIDVNRRQLIAALAALVFGAGVLELSSETMTLTTYYPSPAGIYKMLTSTQRTLLARDGGNVGVGTNNPASKLDVAGEIRLSSTGADCTAANEGAMRYNSGNKQIEVCTGGGWSLPPGAFGGGYQTCDHHSENCPASLCYTKNFITNSCSCPGGFSSIGYRAVADIGGTIAARELQGTGLYVCMKRPNGIVEDAIPGGPEPYPR
ncbi:MAG: hypothetical protein HY078_01345 [Elusimicrobia bacterium]|nr:hypothetical protein [Elusimicrobiota bacterium]